VRPMLDKILRLFGGIEMDFRKEIAVANSWLLLIALVVLTAGGGAIAGWLHEATNIGEFNSARPQRGTRAAFELLEKMQRLNISKWHPNPL
jgi:hypothetical protein